MIVLKTYPEIELNGRKVDDYQTDAFGITQEEIDNASLLFTYGVFENTDRELTDNQLIKLSKKYPSVLYILLYDLIAKDSPIHKKFANDPIVLEYLNEDNVERWE